MECYQKPCAHNLVCHLADVFACFWLSLIVEALTLRRLSPTVKKPSNNWQGKETSKVFAVLLVLDCYRCIAAKSAGWVHQHCCCYRNISCFKLFHSFRFLLESIHSVFHLKLLIWTEWWKPHGHTCTMLTIAKLQIFLALSLKSQALLSSVSHWAPTEKFPPQ